jgi:hypothetical protein
MGEGGISAIAILWEKYDKEEKRIRNVKEKGIKRIKNESGK